MNNTDNMDNIVLYFRRIYLLPNDSAGDGKCMFHVVGASDVVIGESSHVSLQVNWMNQIMDKNKADPLLLSSLYQSNRTGWMLNVDLPKYLDLQKNNRQWVTQLEILFIIIVYGVRIKAVQWFGDAFIDLDTAT